MLFYHANVILNLIYKGVLLLLLIVFACTAYTYTVNLRRRSDDPKKRQYHPFAMILAPITFPLFLSLGLLVLVVRALLFGAFLIVFTVLLVALRKPFLFDWWHKFALRIGDPLLQMNTRLIKMAFSPWNQEPLPT